MYVFLKRTTLPSLKRDHQGRLCPETWKQANIITTVKQEKSANDI